MVCKSTFLLRSRGGTGGDKRELAFGPYTMDPAPSDVVQENSGILA